MSIIESISKKVDSIRSGLFGGVGSSNNWVEQEHELLHKETTLETQTKKLLKGVAEAVGGTVLMSPVAMLMSPVAVLRMSGLGEVMHAGGQVDFGNLGHEDTITGAGSVIDNSSMLYLAPDHQVMDRLYIEENVKERSFFLVENDPDEAISIDAVGVTPEFGLRDIDKITMTPYELQNVGSNPNNPEHPQNILLESIAGRLSKEGIAILPTSMVDIRYDDITLVPVNSLEVGRRGGMRPKVVDSAHVVVGVTEDGQAIAIFAADQQGNLTGMGNGLEGLGIMPLKWGSRDSGYSHVLGFELDSGFYPLLSADGKTVYYPSEEVGTPVAAKNALLVPNRIMEYRSPEFVVLENGINDIADGRYALEDGGNIWDSTTKEIVPGISVEFDGSVFITVDGEELDMGKVAITSNSDGQLVVEQYALINGEWVKTVNPMEQAVLSELEKYKLDPNAYTISVDNEVVTVTETVTDAVTGKETEKVIMISTEEGIKYDLGFAVDQIAAKSCEPNRKFVPSPNSGLLPGQYGVSFISYMDRLLENLGARRYSITFSDPVLVNRDDICWGLVLDGKDLVYIPEGDSSSKRIELIPMSKEEVLEFVINR